MNWARCSNGQNPPHYTSAVGMAASMVSSLMRDFAPTEHFFFLCRRSSVTNTRRAKVEINRPRSLLLHVARAPGKILLVLAP